MARADGGARPARPPGSRASGRAPAGTGAARRAAADAPPPRGGRALSPQLMSCSARPLTRETTRLKNFEGSVFVSGSLRSRFQPETTSAPSSSVARSAGISAGSSCRSASSVNDDAAARLAEARPRARRTCRSCGGRGSRAGAVPSARGPRAPARCRRSIRRRRRGSRQRPRGARTPRRCARSVPAGSRLRCTPARSPTNPGSPRRERLSGPAEERLQPLGLLSKGLLERRPRRVTEHLSRAAHVGAGVSRIAVLRRRVLHARRDAEDLLEIGDRLPHAHPAPAPDVVHRPVLAASRRRERSPRPRRRRR